MTDYLEEVLEEETADREEFRPKRAVVRGSRKGKEERQTEEGAEWAERMSDGPERTPLNRDFPMENGAEEESALFPDLSRNRRKAVPGEDGSIPEKGRRKRGTESERAAEGQVPEGADEAAEEEGFFADLTAGRKPMMHVTERSAFGREEQETFSLAEAESVTPLAEELAEAERLTRFSETENALSESVRSGSLPVWEETGREGAAGILLRALGRAGRVSRVVRGGTGTAVVTLPGESAPGWEPDVESLDRLVRLDARRYDGGFQLF